MRARVWNRLTLRSYWVSRSASQLRLTAKDSYWILLGLLRGNITSLANNTLLNFMDQSQCSVVKTS